MSDTFPLEAVDIDAMRDVLDLVPVGAESWPIDKVVDVRHALEKLHANLRQVISEVDTELIRRLEDGQVRDGHEYKVAYRPEKQRYDHDRILSIAAAESLLVDEETGEMRSAQEATLALIGYFHKLYLSPSTKAKIGGLRVLGIDRGAVETVEWGDRYVKVTPIQFTDQQPPEESNE